MSASVFFVVSRKPCCEPLLPEFLFGEYSRNTESAFFSNTAKTETAFISKNVCKFPKIIGASDWIVTEQCKDQLTAQVKSLWRPVKILEPFRFDWNGKDGFEIFEELHAIQRQEFSEQGKSEHEFEDLISTDPGLAYREFVDRYRIDSFTSETSYYELVAQYASADAKENEYDDILTVDIEPGAPVFSKRKPDSSDLFSLTSLQQYGILGLGSGIHAVSADAFSVLRDFIEAEYYDVVSIDVDTLNDLTS